MLTKFECSGHADAVLKEVEELKLDSLDPDDDTAHLRSDLQLKISSLLRSNRQNQRRVRLTGLRETHRLYLAGH